MADFTIETSEAGGVTRLALAGEFDLAGVPQFERALREAETSGPAAVVADLTGLVFMDSSGLRALVMANDRAQRGGWRLAIVPGPSSVRRVFEVTQMAERLDLVDDPSSVGL